MPGREAPRGHLRSPTGLKPDVHPSNRMNHPYFSAFVVSAVALAAAPAVPSFRNDVVPLMTKIGCNSGACHGALAGKGGMKLSLRGYDPAADHFVLTRQALGRRVDKLDPAHSLVLLKPTMALSHGGGQ